MKSLEYKIYIKETPKQYIDQLVLSLVHSGYEVYFDYDREHVCFTGYIDEVITNSKDEIIKAAEEYK
jgi:hypothetical protein